MAKTTGSTWTQSEIKFLTKNWQTSSCKSIAKSLGRNVQSCYDKASKLGLKKVSTSSNSFSSGRGSAGKKNLKSKKWTESEVNFLISNLNTLSDKEISVALGKSIPAVMSKKQSIKKTKNLRPAPDSISSSTSKSSKSSSSSSSSKSSSSNRWSSKEISYLKKNIKSKSFKQLSKELNRTTASVISKAASLGLSRGSNSSSKSSSSSGSSIKSSKISFRSIALWTSVAINAILAGYIISLFLA